MTANRKKKADAAVVSRVARQTVGRWSSTWLTVGDSVEEVGQRFGLDWAGLSIYRSAQAVEHLQGGHPHTSRHTERDKNRHAKGRINTRQPAPQVFRLNHAHSPGFTTGGKRAGSFLRHPDKPVCNFTVSLISGRELETKLWVTSVFPVRVSVVPQANRSAASLDLSHSLRVWLKSLWSP